MCTSCGDERPLLGIQEVLSRHQRSLQTVSNDLDLVTLQNERASDVDGAVGSRVGAVFHTDTAVGDDIVAVFHTVMRPDAQIATSAFLAYQRPTHRTDEDIEGRAEVVIRLEQLLGGFHDRHDELLITEVLHHVHEECKGDYPKHNRAEREKERKRSEDDALEKQNRGDPHQDGKGDGANSGRLVEVHLALLSYKAATAAEVVRV